MACLLVFPCAAQESLLRPIQVLSHPENSLPVVTSSAEPLYMTSSALLDSGSTLPFEGNVLRTATTEQSTGLLAVETTAEGGQAFQFYAAVPGSPWGLKHTRLLPADTPAPVFTVDALGRTAYVLPATATLVLLDAQGIITRETLLFKDAPYTLERITLVATHPQTGDVLVAAMRGDESEQAVLFSYDLSGVLQWKVALPLPSVYALSIDPQGRFIAVASADVQGSGRPSFRTTILDAEGTVLRTLPQGFSKIAWAEDTADALLIASREAVLYDLATGEERQLHAVPNRQQRWIDAVLSADGQRTVLLAAQSVYASDGFEFQQGHLYSIDAAGQLQQATPEEAPSKRLILASDGNTFSLIRDEQTRQYRWEDVR